MLIGHANKDNEQTISFILRRLKSNNAITLTELYEQLRFCYIDYATIISMAGVVSIPGRF